MPSCLPSCPKVKRELKRQAAERRRRAGEGKTSNLGQEEFFEDELESERRKGAGPSERYGKGKASDFGQGQFNEDGLESDQSLRNEGSFGGSDEESKSVEKSGKSRDAVSKKSSERRRGAESEEQGKGKVSEIGQEEFFEDELESERRRGAGPSDRQDKGKALEIGQEEFLDDELESDRSLRNEGSDFGESDEKSKSPGRSGRNHDTVSKKSSERRGGAGKGKASEIGQEEFEDELESDRSLRNEDSDFGESDEKSKSPGRSGRNQDTVSKKSSGRRRDAGPVDRQGKEKVSELGQEFFEDEPKSERRRGGGPSDRQSKGKASEHDQEFFEDEPKSEQRRGAGPSVRYHKGKSSNLGQDQFNKDGLESGNEGSDFGESDGESRSLRRNGRDRDRGERNFRKKESRGSESDRSRDYDSEEYISDQDIGCRGRCSAGCSFDRLKEEMMTRKLEAKQKATDDYTLGRNMNYFENLCTCSPACLAKQLWHDSFVRDLIVSAALFAVGIKLCFEMDAWYIPI